MAEMQYRDFSKMAASLPVFSEVTSPSNLIIAYAILFTFPKPAGKKNCGYFITDALKTYQVGDGCPLPMPDGADKKTPVEIPELRDLPVNHFCVGLRHGAAMLKDGTIWSWGANDVGQLGHGNESPFSRPKKVATDVIFNKMACTANATIAIARNEDVYQWGQLNPRSTDKWCSPHKCGVSGSQLSVGANHAGVFVGSRLFVWGLGEDGRLGIGSTKDVSCDKPERVRMILDDAAMATRSTAVVDEGGRVRVFGRNYGNLKPKQGRQILTPMPVKRLAEAESVSGSWPDDVYLANMESGDQMIFGDQIAVDDPDADEEGLESKGSLPRKMKTPLRW